MHKKGASSFSVCLLVFVLAFCSVVANTRVIFVSIDGNCNATCDTLDTALQNTVSNTTLQLQPGTHTVRSDYTVTNLTDLSIVGDRNNSSNVVIECDDSLGLIFMNVKRLTITGVIIKNCGFTSYPHVMDLFDTIKQSISVFFDPLVLFSAGIMIVDIEDFVMENSVIQENKGFGMVAVNLIGDSRFSYVDFISNYPSNSSVCNNLVTIEEGGSGGGLFLMYQDYWEDSKNLLAENSTLTYEHAQIMNNYICRRDPFTAQYNRLTRTLESSFALNTSIAGAGGVSVSLGQARYGVSVLFSNCSFINNSALYQNAAMNVFLYNITQGSDVIIRNCLFYQNGGLFYNPDERDFPDNGIDPFGALGIAFLVPIPEGYSNLRTDLLEIQFNSSKVVIQNCTFTENKAYSAGGLMIFSFTSTTQFVDNAIVVKDCKIFHNFADFGSALYITELSYSSFESRVTILIDSIVISSNAPLSALLVPTAEFDTRSAADFSNVQVTLIGNNTFKQNNMTAMYIQSSVLRITGLTSFSNNIGMNGGGLHMKRESYVILIDEADLTFYENTAFVVGGALYVDFRTIRSNSYDCWLFLENVNSFCDISNTCALPNNSYVVKFIRNEAPFGKAVYGSNLFDCPWRNDTVQVRVLDLNNLESFSDLSPSELPIVYDPPNSPEDNFTVNTAALVISTIPDNATEKPIRRSIDMKVEPGQEFTIPLIAYDRLTQSIPLTIFSIINDISASATIGISNRHLLPGGEQQFVDVPIRVNGSVGGEYIVTISTNEVSLRAAFTVRVALKECSLGFVYNNISMSCECEINVLDNVRCNSNRSISFSNEKWIGRAKDGRYIQAPCIRDFCDVSTSDVLLAQPDTQCRNNRAGILCGDCADGYSRVLGGSQCEQCVTNDYLALIIVFVALGILLFFIIAFLNITITDGFINGFIFYSNIFSVYISKFLPVTELAGRPALVVISFLNLNFGIDRCFYSGMSELDLVGLTLIFPLYLLLILLSVTLFGKYVTHDKVSKFYSKIRITHVFATLLYIIYSSCIETCIAILAYLPVTIEGEETLYRWGRNPNILYGEGLHGILVAVSVVLLIVLLPLPIILLVPQISYRIPFIRKYKPVIDAFIAPFDHNRAFWISFRLIFRVLIYVVSVFGVTITQLLIMSFCVTSMTLLQAYLKPFANTSRNIIDTLLMLNLTLFSIAAIAFFDKDLTQEQQVMSFMFVFMYIFIFMLFLLFVHYMLKRFNCTSVPYNKVQKWLNLKLRIIANWFENPHGMCLTNSESGRKSFSNVWRTKNDSQKVSSPVSQTNIQLGNIHDSTRLRESLLLGDLQVNKKTLI